MSRRRSDFATSDAVTRTVALFSALAHPLRLQLLLLLAREGAMSAGALQEALRETAEVEQSALSHQLATLRRGRLVAVERDGRRMIYRLLDEHVAHIVEDALKHANERDDNESGGSEPDGSEPDGSEPDGSEPDGSESGGSEPDGSEPDGSEPDGRRT